MSRSHHPSKSKRTEEYSFLDYKYELNKVFFDRNDLVQDVPDFWLFVKKFESIKKLAASTNKLEDNIKRESLLSFTFLESDEKLLSKLPFRDDRVRHLTTDIIASFKLVVLSYLDFKQKENFAKLKKLRQAQNNLPVAQYRDEIVKSIQEDRVLIVAGDTGCGKSTQVPRYLLNAGFSRIACTQPRRIACISLSKRVAYETLNEYGAEVGYQIRFEKNRRQETKIVFITEGLLLRQVESDGCLSGYDIIVLDEVHERHIHGDFLLGVLKCLLYQRQDFKLILMSATINLGLFSDYFGGNAKVIKVPGRLHPITVNYSPISEEETRTKSDKVNPGPYLRILQKIDEKYPREERGDVLIFMSGFAEITAVVDAAKLYNEKVNRWIILPLHSSLSLAEQDKVFDYPPEGFRKCVISTNIAETSVTIDGIRFVVDSGMVKEMSYDPVCRMQRLKEFWVSRASAEQRKGRAGRTGPGVCYRLFSEKDYSAMQEYTTPEIQRVPLDSVLLQMVSMGLPDARKFPFLEPPPSESIETAILSLKRHGALTDHEKLTPMGQLLSRLPVDIPIGKMLIVGTMFHQIEPVLSLAAALSVQTPFTNRAYRDFECEASRKSIESDHGDPIILLNALKEWLEVKQDGSRSKERVSTRTWCKRRGLEEQRFYEMIKLRNQFKDLLKDCGLLKIETGSLEGMSSAERAIRHGEVKLLKSMKRKTTENAPRSRKILKPDTWTIEEEEDPSTDVRDIDFRLSTNQHQLEKLLSGSTACSYNDLTMLKLILCCGLYPQVAIADEFNHCKGMNEQMFHTQSKPYVCLHPMSFFGNHPQVLQLQDSDLVHAPGFGSRNPLSSKHQLLCYMSLLETNKPYLMNTMRMPAAQTLLLFAKEICVSSDFTLFICDSWLQLKFLHGEPAEKLLSRVVKLRTSWERLLALRLEEEDGRKIERELSIGLVGLMNTEIVYSIKRLLAADLKTIFVGPGPILQSVLSGPNPYMPDYPIVPNDALGGVQLTPYIVYDCLEGDFAQVTMWKCSHCSLSSPMTPLERLQHNYQCQKVESSDAQEVEKEDVPKNPNSKAYQCTECDKTLYLTPIEILKHKKSHAAK